MNVRDPSSRLLKFRLKLDEYDYEIIHKPGKINTNADALSRSFPIRAIPVTSNQKKRKRRKKRQIITDITTSDSSIDFSKTRNELSLSKTINISDSTNSKHSSTPNSSVQENNFQNISPKNISKQKTNQNISAKSTPSSIKSNCGIQNISSPLESTNSTFQNCSNFTYSEFIEDAKDSTFSGKIHPSKEQIPIILQECHDSPTGGHQGILRTFKRIKTRYGWPGMLGDIKSQNLLQIKLFL